MNRRIRVNGLTFHVDDEGSGPCLLLLHGFTGSAATWGPHAARYRERYRTVAVDLIGHGMTDAPPDPSRYRMERCIEDVWALLDALGVEGTAVLGYSMGGRVALHLAAADPGRLWALVVESASPGIDDPEERARRREADEALAAELEAHGIEAFVAKWEGLPLWATQARLPAEVRERVRRQRLQNRPQGLAGSLRGMGAGAMEPLHGRLPGMTVPTLVIAGERDEKYVRLGKQMARAMPRAELAIVPGAGHNVHLEEPDTFDGLVLSFLARHEPGR